MPLVCPECDKEIQSLIGLSVLNDKGVCPDCTKPLVSDNRGFFLVKPAYPGQNFDDVLATIIQRLLKDGFRVLCGRRIQLTREQVVSHYHKLRDRDFFPDMVEYLISGPVFAVVYEHDSPLGAPAYLRQLAGPTLLRNGKPGELRHDFGDRTNNIDHHNVIHVSANRTESMLDTERFLGSKTCFRFFGSAA